MNHNLLAPITSVFHHTNYPHTIPEGNVTTEDIAKFNEIGYSVNTEIPITPGLYKVRIEDKDYVFFIHEMESNISYIKFKNPRVLLLHTEDGKNYKIRLYKINEVDKYKEFRDDYQTLNYSLDNELDVVVIQGKSDYKGGYHYARDIDHPYKLEAPIIITLVVKDPKTGNTKKIYVNANSYIKNVGPAHDLIFIDSFSNKATIEFKTNRITLTGNEENKWFLDEEYSTEDFNVFYFKDSTVKVNPLGQVNCTHVQELEWNKLINPDYYTEGCSPSGNSEKPGIFFKFRKDRFPTLQDFINKIKWWYNATDEDVEEAITEPYKDGTSHFACRVAVEYELKEHAFRTMPFIDKIPSFYNTTLIRAMLNDMVIGIQNKYIVAVVPKDGRIRNEIEQSIENGSSVKKILIDNIILEDVFVSKNELDEDLVNGNGYFLREMVAVVPDDGIIRTEEQQNEDTSIDDIINDNTILENIVAEMDNIHIMCFYDHFRRVRE